MVAGDDSTTRGGEAEQQSAKDSKGAERVISLLGRVPAESRIVLVGKSELYRVNRTQARATQRRKVRQPKRSTSNE